MSSICFTSSCCVCCGTAFPLSGVASDEKLELLIGYLLLSAGLSALIARLYSESLNHLVHQWLPPRKSQSGSERYESNQPRAE